MSKLNKEILEAIEDSVVGGDNCKVFGITPAVNKIESICDNYAKQFAIFLWEYRNNVDKWDWKPLEELQQNFKQQYNTQD